MSFFTRYRFTIVAPTPVAPTPVAAKPHCGILTGPLCPPTLPTRQVFGR